MKAIRTLVLSFCLLGLACGGSDDNGRVTVADVKDSASLKDFVEYAAGRLQGSATFEEAMQLIREFREEGGDWNDGSTYLVLLSRSGGVYIHSKNRKLEDQDWSDLQDFREKNVGQLFLREEGGFVGYHDKDGSPRVSYAFPFTGPSIPLTHPENIDQQVFILLGGFNFEPETAEQSYFDLVIDAAEKGLRIPELSVEAEEVNDRDKLRRFVDEAIYYFTALMGSDEVDLVQLRRFFRVDRGPWRYVSTYIYIMDDRGNVIFNGGNRNIEQTNLSDHPEVGNAIREIICVAKQLGGGYVKYNWNDPNDPNDDPLDGGAGGDSPKLGYARGIPINKDTAEKEDLIYYIFGSGVYLDADGVAETTRTYTPDNSACK